MAKMSADYGCKAATENDGLINEPDRDDLTEEDGVHLLPEQTSGPFVEAFLRASPPSPCFLGLSIRNKMSNRSRLEVLIPWVARRAHTLTVVIGDYIHRHNLIAFNEMQISEAARKAFALGSRATRAARRILSGRTGCRVLSSADLTETPGCKQILKAVSEYYASEPTFMRDVTAEVTAFAARALPKSTAARTGHLLTVLKDYVLEEISMFLYLYDCGHAVEVYPGADLTIMRSIALGLYPRFPVPCPWRTHISVNVKTMRGQE